MLHASCKKTDKTTRRRMSKTQDIIFLGLTLRGAGILSA
jgi:hypothetical protein